MSLSPPPLPADCRRPWVALSGGTDSTVLLHLLRNAPGLRAIHVHHGLQRAADDWARLCRRLCRELGVPLRVLKVTVDPHHAGGPEAAAREARYRAFESVLREGDVLATGHHREDQAETVLLRALRGTGVAGLAAMRRLRPLGRGMLWRPLLDIPPTALREYAQVHGLHGIEDPHNHDPRYARSFLRREVWPLIGTRWPQAGASLARLAEQACQVGEMLAQLAHVDLAFAADGDDALSIAALAALSPARRANALHQWLSRSGPAPSSGLLQRLEREVIAARPDAGPRLTHGLFEVRRYRDRLFRLPALAAGPAPEIELAWTRGRSIALPQGCGRLTAARPPPARLTVRFVRGGERLKPACGGPTRTLRNLFQERGTPPWVRQRIPLLYEADELAAVGDWWFSVPFAARGWLPAWERALPGS